MAKKKLDFSKVETFQKAPEGTHVAKVVEVEEVRFQSGSDGFKVVYEITKGQGKGARIYDNFSLADNALWKLKTLLEALKIKCDGRIMLDTDKMVGKPLEIDVYHEEYEGKTRAKVSEMRKLAKSKAEDEDDEEEDIDEAEDIDDEDDEEEEEEKPKKKPAKKEKKPVKKVKKKPVEEDEDDDEDDDDEEEEEKKPVKKAKKAKKPAKKEPEPKDDDDDDWDDDDWEDD